MEDFLKNKASTYKIAPKASTWAGIEGTLIKRRRKRFAWIFFFGSLILIAGLTAIIMSTGSDTSDIVRSQHNNSENQSQESTSKTSAINSLNDSTKDIEGSISNLLPIKSSETSEEFGEQSAKIKTKPVEIYDDFEDLPQLEIDSSTLESIYQNGLTHSKVVIPKAKDSNQTDKEPLIDEIKESNSDAVNEQMPIQGPIVKTERERKHNQAIDSSKSQQIIVVQDAEDSARSARIPEVKDLPKVAWHQANPGWIFGLSYAFGRSFYIKETETAEIVIPNSLQGKPTTAADEFPSNAYGLQLSIQKQVYKNWFIGTGIKYQRLSWTGEVGEPAPYSLNNDGNKVIEDSISINAGLKEFVSVELHEKDEGYTEGGERTIQSHASYLSFPVFVAYRFPLSKKFTVNGQIGYQFNRLQDVSLLQYYADLNTYVTRNEATSEVRIWNGSMIGGLGFEFALGNKWGLSLGSEYQRFTKSIQHFDGSSPLGRKPYSITGNVGVVYVIR
jgi:hypothetical protein